MTPAELKEWLAGDAWFKANHHAKLVDAFLEWWLALYGAPSDYDQTESEMEEYRTRCAFALMGWHGAFGTTYHDPR